MKLSAFNKLIGNNSYVLCKDKKRIDKDVVSVEVAERHLNNGGSIGWWVTPGYIVVDIDEGKDRALKAIKKLGLKTLMAQTPKGIHMFFKTKKEYQQKVGMILPFGLKCDFRCAEKGYVLLPFGQKNRAFNKTDTIINLPLEATPFLDRKESLLNLKEGDGRNSTLFAHLMAYKNKGADYEQIKKMAKIINNIILLEPLSEKELDTIIKNTKRYEASELNPYLFYNNKGIPTNVNYKAVSDHFINSENMFVLGGECYKYKKGVYIASNIEIKHEIKNMINVDTMITPKRIQDSLSLVLDGIKLQKSAEDLNQRKDFINFENGVWDIKNKKIIEHNSKYLQTIQIPHKVKSYVDFKKTRLYHFLSLCELPESDVKMILEYMAYCLTFSHGLKTFLILTGPSNTGKSTLIRFFESLVGKQNSSNLSIGEITQRFYGTQMYNKLLNCCADNPSMPLKSIELLKRLTGGDQIMYEKKGNPNIFFFTPFVKLLFSFNQLPLQLEEKSDAFYQRIRIATMDKKLELDDSYINNLCNKESIAQTIPYLLSLLPLTKITSTLKSRKAVESLRKDSDTIHAFLKNCCVNDSEGWCYKKDLYEAYQAYCLEHGRDAHKKHAFFRNLKAFSNYKEARFTKNREYYIKGLRLLGTI